MTFEEIPDIKPENKYWKPVLGEHIEGEILGIQKSEYNGKPTQNYVLRMPDNQEKVLPSHAHLEMKLGQAKIGNYVKISCVGEKTFQVGKNPMKVYKVEVDRAYVPKPSLNTVDVGPITEPMKEIPMKSQPQIIQEGTDFLQIARPVIDQKDAQSYALSEAIKMMALTGTPCTPAIIVKLADSIAPNNAIMLITYAKQKGDIVQEQNGTYRGTA